MWGEGQKWGGWVVLKIRLRLRFNDDGCTRLQAGNTLSLDLQSPDRDKGTKSGNIS